MVVVGYNLLILGILFWWAYDVGFFLSFAAFDQKTCDFEIKFINSQTRNVYFKHFKYQVYVLLLFIIHQVASFCGKTIFTLWKVQ